MSARIVASFLMGNLISSLLLSAPTFAQSLEIKKPAPLQPSINTGSCDDMTGPHYWYFIAEPGSFSGTVTRTGPVGDYIEAKLGAGIAYAPSTPGATKILTSDKGKVTNFSGSVKQRTKVMVMIDPGRAGLVRAAENYTISVGGNVAFGEASNLPEICHTYECMTYGLGLTKFNPDGTITCSKGGPGKWQLFDADTKTYILTVPNQPQIQVKYVPAYGFVDAGGGVQAFKQLK
jgi:hypothetical protein